MNEQIHSGNACLYFDYGLCCNTDLVYFRVPYQLKITKRLIDTKGNMPRAALTLGISLRKLIA